MHPVGFPLFLLDADICQQRFELALQRAGIFNRKSLVFVLQNPVWRALARTSFYQQAIRRQLVDVAVVRDAGRPAALHLDWDLVTCLFDQVIRPAGQAGDWIVQGFFNFTPLPGIAVDDPAGRQPG